MTAAATKAADWRAELQRELGGDCLVPAGYMLDFWIIVIGKYILKTGALTSNENLRLLEVLHHTIGGYITGEMLSMIEPAGETTFNIFDAAMELGDPENPYNDAAFRELTSERTFDILVTLNPSIAKAIRWHEQRRGGHKWPIPPSSDDEDTPLQHGGNDEIPPRFATAAKRPQQFAIGSPSHANGGVDAFTGQRNAQT